MQERSKLVKGKQARFVFAAAAKRPASVSGGGGGRAGQAGPVGRIGLINDINHSYLLTLKSSL